MTTVSGIALVTGGGSGIGRAICLRLAADGARVAVTDANLEGARETAEMIRATGGTAHPARMDITDAQQIAAAVSDVRSAVGPIDILVNNAGWDRMERFLDNPPDFWRKVIDINFQGPIQCTRAVVDDMVAKNCGKIVFISSDAARVGSSGEAVYAGCKGGVVSFAKSLARELARHRINVNCVCPGPTDTPLIRGMAAEGSEKLVESLRRAIPFGRMAEPQEIAAAVAFFASPDSDFVTGQVLSVSGGLTMAG